VHAAEPVLVREREGVDEHVVGGPAPGEHRRPDRRQQVRVRERHALGPTRGPRGERQHRRRRSPDVRGFDRLPRRLGLGEARTRGVVQRHHRRGVGGERSERGVRGPAGERGDGSGHCGDPGELGPGERRADGQRRRAHPERGEVRDDEGERVRAAQEHAVAGFDPADPQPARDPGRAVVELPMGGRRAVDREGGRITASPGRRVERRRQRSGAQLSEELVVRIAPEVGAPRRARRPCDRPVGERVRHRRARERGANPPGSPRTTPPRSPAARDGGTRAGRPRRRAA
jgi:hypothetical protein